MMSAGLAATRTVPPLPDIKTKLALSCTWNDPRRAHRWNRHDFARKKSAPLTGVLTYLPRDRGYLG
jgi:hypothetical protein